MLNKAERYKVAEIYRICGIVGLFPIDVDLTNWHLTVPSIKKRCVCFLFWSTLLIHTAYKIGSLAYTYLFDPDVQLHQLVIHTVVAMAYTTFLIWYDTICISDPALFAKYFNATLRGNVEDLCGRAEESKRTKWTTRLREYSVQDLIALSLPCMALLPIPAIVASFAFDPSMRVLVYAALPANLQTWTTLVICTLEEARVLSVVGAIATPVLQLQVISFDLISNRLKLLMRNMQNGNMTTRSVYMALRSLQLYVSIVNNVNSYMIFTWKLTTISACILTSYSAVAHFHEHPVFGFMCSFIFFEGTLIYIAIYNKAFKIPQLFNQAAAYALLYNRRVQIRPGLFRRRILSIQNTGIKVGNFHKMEPESTPTFIDFVGKNIVNMLVAYG